MSYLSERAPRKMDIALLLKVCPTCLGDLVFTTDYTGNYYRCLQCNERAVPRDHSPRMPDLSRRRLLRRSLAG